jgi:hypothetical protein
LLHGFLVELVVGWGVNLWVILTLIRICFVGEGHLDVEASPTAKAATTWTTRPKRREARRGKPEVVAADAVSAATARGM